MKKFLQKGFDKIKDVARERRVTDEMMLRKK